MLDTYTIQTIISLINTIYVIGINIYYEWGSYHTLQLIKYPVLIYNIIDIVIGHKYYIKHDKMTLIHHLIIILASLYVIFSDTKYLLPIVTIYKWFLYGEVTSMFNNIRIILRNSVYKTITRVLFAVIFIVFRSIMTIGLLYDYPIYENNKIISFIVVTFTFLNIIWGYMIFEALYKEVRKLHNN